MEGRIVGLDVKSFSPNGISVGCAVAGLGGFNTDGRGVVTVGDHVGEGD